MDIKSIQAAGVYNSFLDKAAADKTGKQPLKTADGGDKLELSGKATDLYDASLSAQKALTPEKSREDRIAEIKSRIENGTYSVSSRAVASSVLLGRLFDSKA